MRANPSATARLTAEDLAELIKTIDAGAINNNQAKEVMVEMFATRQDAAGGDQRKRFRADLGYAERSRKSLTR